MSFELRITGKNKRQKVKRLLKGYHTGANSDMVNTIISQIELESIWHEINTMPQHDEYFADIRISGSKSNMYLNLSFEAFTKTGIMGQVESALNMLRSIKND